ncbi:MAG: deoxyribonuclease IV [Erysipelotrichaceae bacterium]
MIIGSHVSMSEPDYLLGALLETLSYQGNAMMIYSGAPQNCRRKDISEMKIKEAHLLMKEKHFDLNHIVVHAPYIINLANSFKPETFELGVDFLRLEIERVKAIGASILVLHPGSHVNGGVEVGLKQIIKGLDLAMDSIGEVQLAIETMAGKGSEIGSNFEEIAYLKKHAKYRNSIKVCLDTCHLHDAGFDLNEFDSILDQFDQMIGIEHIVCIHINDSKNCCGAHKDRHANIGFGEIGFETLNKIVHNPRLANIPKILETPYVQDQAPYKYEIEMLKQQHFDSEMIHKLEAIKER